MPTLKVTIKDITQIHYLGMRPRGVEYYKGGIALSFWAKMGCLNTYREGGHSWLAHNGLAGGPGC